MQSKNASRINAIAKIGVDFSNATLKRQRMAGQEVEINDLLENPYQPRMEYKEESINELAESIEKSGLIQPIIVGVIESKYYIIAGHRRVKAYQKLGFQKIQALLRDYTPDEFKSVSSLQTLIENIQRENLSHLELALAFNRLIDNGAHRTYADIASGIGKSERYVKQVMSLLKLSEEVQQEILKGQKIPLDVLEAIARIKPDSKQMEAFERYARNEIDVKTLKMEYLSNKAKPKDNPISFNEKRKILSINLNQYKSKEEAIRVFTDFINKKLSLF